MKNPRLNIAFSDVQMDRLGWMASELHTTKSDVLKKALALLQICLKERAAGNQIAVSREGVVLKEIVLS